MRIAKKKMMLERAEVGDGGRRRTRHFMRRRGHEDRLFGVSHDVASGPFLSVSLFGFLG